MEVINITHIKSKYVIIPLFLIVGILALVCISNSVSAGSNSTILYPEIQGIVQEHPAGTYTWYPTSTFFSTILEGIFNSASVITNRTVFQFNLTSIPNGAIIDEVDFVYSALSYSQGGSTNFDWVDLKGVDLRTATAAQIYTAITTGHTLTEETVTNFFGWGTRNVSTKGVNGTGGNFAAGYIGDWFDNSIYGGGRDIRVKIQNNITRGYISFGSLWLYANPAIGYYWMYSNLTTGKEPYMFISYHTNAPVFNYTSPADGATDINLTWPQIIFNISHTTNNLMNYTLWWYNWSASTWDPLQTETGIHNKTVFYNLTNVTDICYPYYWYVTAEDNHSNYSDSGPHDFTTNCPAPPTNISLTDIANIGTMVTSNLSFTPYPPHNGTTHTIVYYSEDWYPKYGEGTLAGNVTNGSIIIGGLKRATCYYFTLWTYWNCSLSPYNALNISYLSSPSETENCTGYGDIVFYLRYENTSYPGQTNDLINLSAYPGSTHRIRIFYANSSEDIYFINSDTYNASGHHNNITVYMKQYPIYFELYWNYSIPSTAQPGPQYRRILTPYAVENISGNNSITFYVTADKLIYGDWYTINGTFQPWYSLENSMSNYIFNFDDYTRLFIPTSAIDVYSTIYTYNNTKKLIIQQQYWDAALKIYPTLVYKALYFIGVNNNKGDGTLYEQIGSVPTDNVYPNVETITIVPLSSEVLQFRQQFQNSTYGWINTGTGLGLFYHYIDDQHQTVNLVFTVINSTGFLVAYQQVNSSSNYNFTYPVANQSQEYIIYVNLTLKLDTNKYVTYTIQVMTFKSVNALISKADLEAKFTGIFGRSPFFNIDTGANAGWVEPMIGFTAIIMMCICMSMKQPILIIVGPGATLFALGILISGVSIGIAGAGIFLIVIGIVFYGLYRIAEGN